MKHIILLPILIPILTAISCLLAWNRRRLQRLISVCGAAGLLGTGIVLLATVSRDGIQATQIGNWPAPFGITLAADLFSSMMVVITGLMGLSVVVYSLESTDIEHEAVGYRPLLHILLLGVCGSFVTGDLFNLYVWFEVMLIASFVLLAVLTILIGFYAEPLFTLSMEAAEQLLNPAGYMEAVLGGAP